MAIILPANTLSGGFEVANSCRFNDGDTAYMHKDFGTPTDGKKWTLSMWVKRGTMGANQYLATCEVDSSHATYIRFHSSDKLQFYDWDSPTEYNCNTNKLFRDPGAWYHLVFVWDSANGTAGNRMRIYVNGTEETSLASDAQPATTRTPIMNTSGETVEIGRSAANSGPFDGYMAEVVFIDGQALTPTSFGEFNEDSPTIWQPIDVSGLTFGTNGFYLDFEASDNLGNDANGGTDLTEVNLAAADSSTDTPTNNFCTMSPIASLDSPVMSQGNCYMTNDGSDEHAVSTFAASNGRWYFEVKVTVQNSNNALVAGISDVYMSQKELAEGWCGMDTGQYGYVGADGKIYHADDGGTAHGNTITTNDILGVYVDLEDNKLYFSKNGTLQNSGTGYSITAPASTTGGAYHFCTGDWYGSTHNVDYGVNFGGCPPFALTSAVSDDNNYGNFEYSPNITGDGSAKKFYSLCTKNLAEYG